MEVVKITRALTMDDVKELNESLPKFIEIKNLKGQKSSVLAELNPKIKIRVLDDEAVEDKVDEPEIKTLKMVKDNSYTEFETQELAQILKQFEDIESGIDSSFNNLEAALYTYIELIKRIAPLELESLENKNDSQREETIKSIIKQVALPKGYASLYKALMERLDIPCKVIEGENGYAWNEIKIDDEFYPLDVTSDAKFFRDKTSEGKLGVCKFLTDKEFYFDKLHSTSSMTEEEIKNIRALEESEISKALEKINYVQKRKETEIRPVINIKSKALSEIFGGNEVTTKTITQTAEKRESIKISVTDDTKTLAEDLIQIGTYYPELLSSVELENTTDKSVNMQEVIDSIYTSRKDAEKLGRDVEPIEIIISSSNSADFDLDFSNAPERNDNNTPVDTDRKNKVTFRSLDSKAIKIPSLTGKLPSTIEEIEVDGLDLEDLDLQGSGVKSLVVKSEKTINLDKMKGFEELDAISFDTVDPVVLSSRWADIVSPTSNIHDLSVSRMDFKDRKVLQELVNNPNLVRIALISSRVNDIDGLESFDGRLASLNLYGNDLNVNDIERIGNFQRRNPYVSLWLLNNTNVINLINSSARISDETQRLLIDVMYEPGSVDTQNKVTLTDYLASESNVPYYIKDAKLIRDELKVKNNPVMLESDDEIDTVDFTEPHLQGATLLLTKTQIERLLNSGKVLTQDIRIKIESAKDLSVSEAKDLSIRMTNSGMRLSGVQIFDAEKSNRSTQIAPYTTSEYITSRDLLDRLISGINLSEPDIDKFAVIYSRLRDHITYDHDACNHNDRDESMVYAQKCNTSRNLLGGLADGTCVCAGYADILRNALDLVGIDARIVSGWGSASRPDSYHAWNQVCLDDGTGTKRWYNTDLTWDNNTNSTRYTLLGERNFTNGMHDKLRSRNVATTEVDDYDRVELRNAFARAATRNLDFRTLQNIDIPENPVMPVEILDQDRIANEYARRKKDMYAKFYGDRDYQAEFDERNDRFNSHVITETDVNGIEYRKVEDYPEKEEDEKFLLLEDYSNSLERMTRYENGDTSVYSGTPDQINAALERDRQYVETRNNTFDQHKNTQRDLATLGKYGEKVPYIPRQNGVIRNIGRAVGNVAIFGRNLVAPLYRAVGKYVAQPIHRLATRGRAASPYRNNYYHRMVARREYFEDKNRAENPNRPLRNFIKSRIDAFVKYKEGNEAVLRAGASDIKENIVNQETARVLIQNLENRIAEFDDQIRDLNDALLHNPHAPNADAVRQAISDKTYERNRVFSMMEVYKANKVVTQQTDAISEKQHAIASKEVNTMRVTVIKGVAKGVATKLIGPKIHDWLIERNKIAQEVDVTVKVPETRERWVEPTYKDEVVPVYKDVLDNDASLSEIMQSNGGKDVTGYYSVWGGERGGSTYTLTGNEKITAVFEARGNGGTGLSDTVGLQAPTLTDKVFTNNLLNPDGLLNQNISLDELVAGLNVDSLDADALANMYVSVGDRYWVKLSDLVSDATKKIQVGEEIRKVIDVPGHMEEYVEMVDKVQKSIKYVTNPEMVKKAAATGKIARGAMYVDGVVDVAENLRPTTSNVKDNKRRPRNYTFDDDVDDLLR